MPAGSHVSTGNRCGHNPRRPVLTCHGLLPKGKGGLPRILSLAAERAKAWYDYPQKCPVLQANPHRRTRSERREACQRVIEAILAHLDLASLCLGVPTVASGFIDVDMDTLARDAGLGKRRCERAIRIFREAGFLKSVQPRTRNEEGAYFGCRAIRVVSKSFFEWLGLGPMLDRERRRATAALRQKAQQAKRTLSDLMRRMHRATRNKKAWCPSDHPQDRERRVLQWNRTWADYVLQGHDAHDAQRRTNELLGYPADYSPGQENQTHR